MNRTFGKLLVVFSGWAPFIAMLCGLTITESTLFGIWAVLVGIGFLEMDECKC